MKAIIRFIPLLVGCHFLAAQSVPEEKVWTEILGPAKGTIPPDPGGDLTWRDDFVAALAEAKRTNRPLLVSFRCLPCKQCADFDKNVLEGGPTLGPLLRRFVTVRLTDAAQLDERYFPYRTHQDLDLSWWGYFLSPEGDLYGVFGGK
ncbi:MAG: thioredoxin family protein, partial [Verrucomicrobiales bacterium]|nr:thioredoxin family protein [Verrucomicrobiales bacterium]